MSPKALRAIGLMSGTSMDGIDVALLTSDGEALVEPGASLSLPYDGHFRDQLKQALDMARSLTNRDARPAGLAATEQELTLRHVTAVESFLQRYGLKSLDIDLVGFHGQTVLHRPEIGLTIQIGDGALLAERIGIPIVYDMRANDMRHGGQGAPLVPVYHQALAARLRKGRGDQPVAFVNIGGISNLTFVGREGDLIAFDSGPGNTLIDQWVEAHTGQSYDAGGRIAASGRVQPDLVARYLGTSFFTDSHRRSLDRGDFPVPAKGSIRLEDGARTLAFVTARAIITSCTHLPEFPAVLAICGGGRLNPVIMEDLAELAAHHGAQVISVEHVGLNGDAMEAEAWAYLAIRAARGLPLTFPGTTGVSHPVSGGVLARPTAITDR